MRRAAVARPISLPGLPIAQGASGGHKKGHEARDKPMQPSVHLRVARRFAHAWENMSLDDRHAQLAVLIDRYGADSPIVERMDCEISQGQPAKRQAKQLKQRKQAFSAASGR